MDASAKTSATKPPPSKTSHRPPHRRSAKQRREQRARADARVVGRLVYASTVLASHRGCQPGKHLAALAAMLAAKPTHLTPAAASAPEGVSLLDVNLLDEPLSWADSEEGDHEHGEPQEASAVESSTVYKPRPMASAKPLPVPARLGQAALGAVQRLVQLFEDGGRAEKPQKPQVTTPHLSPIEEEDEDLLDDDMPPDVFLEEDGGRAAKPQKPHPTTPRQSPIEDEDDSRLDDQAFEAFLRVADARTAEREASLAAWDAAGTG